MPIVAPSRYRPPPLMGNGHLQTILPSLLRRVGGLSYRRERITTPDGDFIDLDWSRCGSPHLVLLCHGLEGSSQASYMRGMARAFNRAACPRTPSIFQSFPVPSEASSMGRELIQQKPSRASQSGSRTPSGEPGPCSTGADADLAHAIPSWLGDASPAGLTASAFC